MSIFLKVLLLATTPFFFFFFFCVICHQPQGHKIADSSIENKLLGQNIFRTARKSYQPPHLLENLHKRAIMHTGRFRYRVIAAREVEKNVTWFFELLLSFITSSCFDSAGFGAYEDSLESSLEVLQYQYEHCDSITETIQNSYNFAGDVFEDMKWAAEIMNHLDLNGKTQQSIIHKLVQLNVRMYALFDVQGRPNPQIIGYWGSVNKFRRTISFWHKSFSSIKEVTLLRKIQFEYQHAQAEEMISKLIGNT